MKNFLVFTILIFLSLVIILQAFFLPKSFGSKEETVFKVSRGEEGEKIAFNLEKAGLIKDKFLFRIYTFLKGGAKKLQAGLYALSPSMSIAQIFNKIVSGDGVKEKITIIEGWSLKDIAGYLEGKGMGRPELAGQLEGYLFPDTYLMDKDASLDEIVRAMLDNFGQKTAGLEEEIGKEEKTMSEVVTMASLLEKEVKDYRDKQVVAGILWKRLQAGMPLQVDATITYITGKKTTEISKAETEIDSPYNTYKYRGLPKGPICNPGLESIRAAIYPEQSDYWYYLSTPEGETVFSKTLEEHNLAKAEHL